MSCSTSSSAVGLNGVESALADAAVSVFAALGLAFVILNVGGWFPSNK